MIKAIFYDFDGVIKESSQIKTEAFYNLYLKHGEGIAEMAKEHHLQNGGVSRYEKIKYYHKTYLGIELSPEAIEAVAREFSKIVLQKVIDSDYVPGAVSSIKALAKTKKLFIVTGTPQSEIDYVMNALEIKPYFEGVFGSPENKIELSQRIMDQTGLKPEHILFVGDALADYNAATHFSFRFFLREHAENQSLFKALNVVKSKDLFNLVTHIDNILI